MRWLKGISLTLCALGISVGTVEAADHGKGQIVFQQHCAACHGDDRLGRIGPALLPENLKRLRKKKALKVIANGRPATQMPAFGQTLNKRSAEPVHRG